MVERVRFLSAIMFLLSTVTFAQMMPIKIQEHQIQEYRYVNYTDRVFYKCGNSGMTIKALDKDNDLAVFKYQTFNLSKHGKYIPCKSGYTEKDSRDMIGSPKYAMTIYIGTIKWLVYISAMGNGINLISIFNVTNPENIKYYKLMDEFTGCDKKQWGDRNHNGILDFKTLKGELVDIK